VDGQPFTDKKSKSRAGKGAHSVPEKAHTFVTESQHTHNPDRAGNGAHSDCGTVPESPHKSILPLPGCSDDQLDIPPFLDRRPR
jgi:hypothetical protein